MRANAAEKEFSLFGNLRIARQIDRPIVSAASNADFMNMSAFLLVGGTLSPKPLLFSSSGTGCASFRRLSTNVVTDIRVFTKYALCVLPTKFCPSSKRWS